MVYYDEIDIRTLLFESFLCNDLSIRYLLFIGRFKSVIEKLSLVLVTFYIFLEVAMKFKLLNKSRSLQSGAVNNKSPGVNQKGNPKLSDYSIFEHYIYNEKMRFVLNTLILEAIIKIELAMLFLWAFYRTVNPSNSRYIENPTKESSGRQRINQRKNSRLVFLYGITYCLMPYMTLFMTYIWSDNHFLGYFQSNMIYLVYMFFVGVTFNKGIHRSSSLTTTYIGRKRRRR